MENKRIAIEPKTEDFNLKADLGVALFGALYYLIIYIPFVLPFIIWGKAASRISLLWESKAIDYTEKVKEYPLFSFYFFYYINFLFDAMMVLIWPIGFIVATVYYMIQFEHLKFLEGYILVLFYFYVSVISIRLAKEITFFILNYLVTWMIEVITNIGRFLKNMWLLNFVHRKKENI